MLDAYAMKLINKAMALAKHAKRKTVTKEDIMLASK
jgi:histone H3/H4